MQTILTSGTYQASTGESFRISQDVEDDHLVSGRDCKLKFYPDPRYVQATDFVQLNLFQDHLPCGAITIHKRCYQPLDIFNIAYEFDVMVKAFMLNRTGQYEFSFSFRDRYGKEIRNVSLPSICFSHEMSYLANHWIPHGLVI
jgi:hypothetical protein